MPISVGMAFLPTKSNPTFLIENYFPLVSSKPHASAMYQQTSYKGRRL